LLIFLAEQKSVEKQADTKSSPQAKAERVRSVRAMAGFSRREIEENYGINGNTLSGWERGIHTGLSKKGAIQLIEMLKDKNIACTLDWLLHGIGSGPKQLSTASDESNAIDAGSEIRSIHEEFSVFRKYHSQTLDLIVQDSTMAPFFNIGDYVMGIQHKQSFQKYIGLDCIVELTNGEILLRKLAKGKVDNRFSLICTNLDPNSLEQNRYDVEIESLAPVIFIRKVEENLLSLAGAK
jgi:transcriptional regulator with XRE-family HTH domain